MLVEFLEEAREELVEGIAYYDEQRAGLGDEFLLEVKRAVGRIEKFPRACAKVSRYCRRCQLHRFPYGLIYRAEKDRLFIVAVMHLSRKPGYWRRRM